MYATAEEAMDAGAQGYNLRCNRCGTFGATWTDLTERPGWGSLALCPLHKQELADEHARHQAALAVLRQVNFEQPPQTIRRREYDF